ncbi:MAG: VWA domain-containing protein [Pedosphaera sp.]|nr:VWA domain-containing protein [Pedosphaera sp.]
MMQITTQQQSRFGLMPVLDAALKLPRTVLPLKSVRYHFVARGGMAEVEMVQIYCQENSTPLDCEYLFPLPADGAVYRCEATINGRVICARIEEREAAKKIIEEKKAEGRRTALVESERDNLFTLSLGNLQPQDVVEVKLAYLQPLRRFAGHVSLDLPLCPGIRYIPGNALLRSNRGSGVVDDTDQVPDASRITPPRIDGEHPDAAFIELDGRVEAGFLDGDVTSPSHKLTATRKADLLHLALAQGGNAPDRDLALRWKERDAAQVSLRGWTSHDKGHDYTMLELRAPASAEATDAVPQDFYFLVDRSGSMGGGNWEKAIEALHGCVGAISPKDRVAVTFFESSFQDFDTKPIPAASLMADRRFREIVSMGVTGGTEMELALRHVLEKVERFSKGRPAALVLITDAQIGNEQEIVDLMRKHPTLPMHCFGIGATLNDSLLLDLVRQQGGTFLALQPSEDVAGVVTRLGRTLRQPVLVNLQVSEDWELAAGAIPNLYAGQIHLVSIRAKNASKSNTLKMLARDHHNADVSLEFNLMPVQESGPRLRWCKERLVTLVAQDDKTAAITLSKEANLLCTLTAFMAWDEAEKVTVAKQRLIQPAIDSSDMYHSLMRQAVACRPVAACMALPLMAARPIAKECMDIEYGISEPSTPLGSSYTLMDRFLSFCGVGASAPPVNSTPPLLPTSEAASEMLTLLQERLLRFMSALSRVRHDSESVRLLIDLRNLLRQTTDLATLNLVAQLLDECERDLQELEICKQRLHELTSTPSAGGQGNSANVQQETSNATDTMERLGNNIRERIEDFLDQD